jgi:hypothetical protein
MTLGAFILLAFVLGIVAYDWVSLRGKNRRAVLLEVLVFLVGAVFIAFPERATALAHFVGIGRGVDFLMYPIVIWLVRESLMTRRRRLEYDEKLTGVVRALAISEARVAGAGSPAQVDPSVRAESTDRPNP